VRAMGWRSDLHGTQHMLPMNINAAAMAPAGRLPLTLHSCSTHFE
jgi:hypothetical protein